MYSVLLNKHPQKECKKDDICNFFVYEVNDHNDWSDKCGSTRYMGSECLDRCCKQQEHFCRTSQTLAYQKMNFYNECMTQRGCKEKASCDSIYKTSKNSGIFFNYDVDVNNSSLLCGATAQGGAKCLDACCANTNGQLDYCLKNTMNEMSTFYDCMKDRSCDKYAIDAMLSVGSPTKKACTKDADCAETASDGTTDTSRKCYDHKTKRVKEGGKGTCRLETCNVKLRNSQQKVFDMKFMVKTAVGGKVIGKKCSEAAQGGAVCTSLCCKDQIKYCKGNCAGDTERDKCLYDCAEQRGCADKLACDDYNNKINIPGDPNLCGSKKRGGNPCKSNCCSQQASEKKCGTLEKTYMEDRGCSTTKPFGGVSWGFYQSGHTWSSKCTPSAADSAVNYKNKCVNGNQCTNHALGSTHAGSNCCRKRGSKAGSDTYCIDKKQDNIDAWWCPIDINCFKGESWDTFLGIGGDCTSDNHCCTGKCLNSDKTAAGAPFSLACALIGGVAGCHPDGVNCKGKTTCTKTCVNPTGCDTSGAAVVKTVPKYAFKDCMKWEMKCPFGQECLVSGCKKLEPVYSSGSCVRGTYSEKYIAGYNTKFGRCLSGTTYSNCKKWDCAVPLWGCLEEGSRKNIFGGYDTYCKTHCTNNGCRCTCDNRETTCKAWHRCANPVGCDPHYSTRTTCAVVNRCVSPFGCDAKGGPIPKSGSFAYKSGECMTSKVRTCTKRCVSPFGCDASGGPIPKFEAPVKFGKCIPGYGSDTEYVKWGQNTFNADQWCKDAVIYGKQGKCVAK